MANDIKIPAFDPFEKDNNNEIIMKDGCLLLQIYNSYGESLDIMIYDGCFDEFFERLGITRNDVLSLNSNYFNNCGLRLMTPEMLDLIHLENKHFNYSNDIPSNKIIHDVLIVNNAAPQYNYVCETSFTNDNSIISITEVLVKSNSIYDSWLSINPLMEIETTQSDIVLTPTLFRHHITLRINHLNVQFLTGTIESLSYPHLYIFKNNNNIVLHNANLSFTLINN